MKDAKLFKYLYFSHSNCPLFVIPGNIKFKERFVKSAAESSKPLWCGA
jgi:hypothetical protein